MDSTARIAEGTTREEHVGPREQFVRQVEDESLPANQVLREQLSRDKPDNAAPLFVP